MPEQFNKLSQFWSELKRRKVFRVIAMYAAAAYVIIELSNNIVLPLNLPEWVPALIIVLLVIGFPFALIFSWIFDVTPEGLKKTKSAKETESSETTAITAKKRRFKISDGIIIALVIVVCILLYPKLFRKDKLEDIRDEEGRISVAVMPFKNTTGDSLYNWYSNGISSILINGLSLSSEISVIDNQTMFNILEDMENLQYASMTSPLVHDLASSIHGKSYIWGDFIATKEKLLINLKLIDTGTNQIITTDSEETHRDSIIHAVQLLSERIRNYLEIKSYEQDLGREFGEFAITNSPEAYRHYLEGFRYLYSFNASSYDLAVQSLKAAIENDPAFTEAYILLSRAYGWSFVNYGLLLRDRESMQYLDLAAASQEKISLYDQISINQQRAYLEKNQEELIRANEQLVSLRPLSPQHWQYSALDYDHAHQYEKAVIAYEKGIELYKKVGFDLIVQGFLRRLGSMYHKLGNHEKENELYKEALNINTSFSIDHIIYSQAVCALSQDDTIKANERIAKYRSNKKAEDLEDYWIDYDIGMIHLDAEKFDKAMNIFRELIAANPQEPLSKWRLGFILIDRELDIGEGMELINKALEIEPDNANFLYVKGSGYYKQGRIQEAYEIIDKAWDLRLRYDHDHYLLLQEVKHALDR